MSEQKHTPEPFGFFKAHPFGWTDCAETEEGATPLFDKQAVDSLTDRLAELEKQEPVAWEITVGKWIGGDRYINDTALSRYHRPGAKPLFAAPVVSPNVEKLNAEIAELKASRGLRHVQQLQAENQSLKTELEAARKDAERYRFLKSVGPEALEGENYPKIALYGLQGAPEDAWNQVALRTNDFEMAIDAAIEQAKGGA